MPRLIQLHLDIDARVQHIRETYPEWLCGKGCDGCCQRLADIPQLTAAEWALLAEGLAALPSAQQADIAQKISALGAQTSRPVICPMLDHRTGACQVYDARPVACRTYGFYVERDKGLYCHEIERQVAEGQLQDAMWGNHDAIERDLRPLGPRLPLTEWFARSTTRDEESPRRPPSGA